MNVARRARAFLNRLKAGCLVLCYHRVSDDADDRWGNAVSIEHFAAHVAAVRSRYGVMSLNELVAAIESDDVPAGRSVVVTFDDGYAVNCRTACDVLRKAHVPATFYVNTAWLDGEPFWWDALAHGNADAAIDTLRSELKAMPQEARRRVLARVSSARGNVVKDRPDYAPMRREDVAALGCEPLFTVAAHTHSHPSLARLSPDAQRAEIIENKRTLERITGRPVTHFSYPFGSPDDFDDTTISELRTSGFRSAATTGGIPVRWPADVYRIPRLSVKNWSRAKFEQELNDRWAQ